jgi:hypothetical protein
VARNTSISVFLPTNRNRARAYPADVEITMVAAMVTDETHRLFAKKTLNGVRREVQAST